MIYAAYIAIPVVFVSLIILGGIYKAYRRRHTVTYSAISRKDLEEEYQRQVARKETQMRLEVEKRIAEEDDTAKGHRIWFSRYVQSGGFKHWVLIIEDTKYELRRDDSNGKYKANIASWTIDKEKREAAIAERKVPHVDGYYVCLIGWTKKAPQELKNICDEVIAQFGKYNIVWNNCQDFLQTFADRIISEKALDWSWFRENTKTEYQEAQALEIPTPDEIVAANRAAAQQQLNAQNQHRIRHNLDAMSQQIQLQNQIQLQVQLQVQQQIQMQNQIQIQNQIQMQTMG
ncbi:hypothetical protein EV127DRAFT_449180 [Xylaria flabelliformis]|nr:hypothetical protein EV127DRAFT_449180 [Xylaria flabelliformis]